MRQRFRGGLWCLARHEVVVAVKNPKQESAVSRVLELGVQDGVFVIDLEDPAILV